MVKEIVQNILVYVVMVTVLKSLISNQSFLEIFRFICGIILLLLFVSPVMSVLSSDTNWYDKLEKNMLQVDQTQIEQELSIAEGSFEKVLLKECEQEVGEQVKTIAAKEGFSPAEMKVEVHRGKSGTVQVQQIQLSVEEEAERTVETGNQEEVQEISVISDVQIDLRRQRKGGEMENDMAKTDRVTKLLQKKICHKFSLPEEAVKVWRSSGKSE